jgi:DNA repair protein RecN (Recombination protein N)
MLTRLSVTNYALIRDLQVDFGPGFNIITGETGAGKSILLGALGLILGNRADLQVLKDNNEKCIIEGTFRIGNYAIDSFFTENDLDPEPDTILRREITNSGKSRAFINDTPVSLNILKELGNLLIDIHSQHQNLSLADNQFQLNIVDAIAITKEELSDYTQKLKQYKNTVALLANLKDTAEKAKADLGYFQFQFDQLNNANLRENEQIELEKELEILTHAEEIKSTLNDLSTVLDGNQISAISQIKDGVKRLLKIKAYYQSADTISTRLESCYLEMKDIVSEISTSSEKIEFDPGRIEKINESLSLIYNLQQKHHVSSVAELISLKNSFGEKIDEAEGFDEEILILEKLLAEQEEKLNTSARILSEKRKSIFGKMQENISTKLRLLAMPNAQFVIRHSFTTDYTAYGLDRIDFLFSANKDVEPGEISRIASGGEMSRLMLAIKSVVSGSKILPTIIFDEIDSGISGETAFRMAAILKDLSEKVQVINITHLPQIAGKGDTHYLVYKVENEEGTSTFMKKLTGQERIEEIARMVAGDQYSETSIDTAKELLNRPK